MIELTDAQADQMIANGRRTDELMERRRAMSTHSRTHVCIVPGCMTLVEVLAGSKPSPDLEGLTLSVSGLRMDRPGEECHVCYQHTICALAGRYPFRRNGKRIRLL